MIKSLSFNCNSCVFFSFRISALSSFSIPLWSLPSLSSYLYKSLTAYSSFFLSDSSCSILYFYYFVSFSSELIFWFYSWIVLSNELMVLPIYASFFSKSFIKLSNPFSIYVLFLIFELVKLWWTFKIQSSFEIPS